VWAGLAMAGLAAATSTRHGSSRTALGHAGRGCGEPGHDQVRQQEPADQSIVRLPCVPTLAGPSPKPGCAQAAAAAVPSQLCRTSGELQPDGCGWATAWHETAVRRAATSMEDMLQRGKSRW
jgi:hypothetical protein